MRPRFFWGLDNMYFSKEKLEKTKNLLVQELDFDPHFPNIWRARKRYNIYIMKVLKKYWKYWKYGSNYAWKQQITLSFYLKENPDT